MRKAILLICLLIATQAQAVRDSRPTALDSRIKVIVYNPDDVFKYTGYYNYQASIDFSAEETIQSVSMGDTTAWQIVPSGFRLFLKPIDKDATTNMTVITNKRVYYFELYAEEAEDIRDPNLAFNVRFLYPDDDKINIQVSNDKNPDLDEPENYNFNYSISGSDEIAPLKIFDDGTFTYFEFKHVNGEIPAIFAVDSALREELVNHKKSGKYIIVERIYKKMALKLGKHVTCVYNEAY